MKIYVFDVRDDELESIALEKSKYDYEIVVRRDSLTKENIHELEKGSAVSVLGMNSYGEEEMKLLSKQEIYYLSTRTIGFNHIDLEAAKRYGVHVCNASYAPNGVADYTVMMMLLCLRHYKQALWRMQVNDFSLGGLMGKELKDLTVGIIGTGRIGTQVAKNLSGFGCKIVGYDPYENESFKEVGNYVSLEELYKISDIITLHVALNDSNHHMINEETISKMKDGVVLINCARGPLMDLQALIQGIESEKIGALGLDTIETEEEIVHKDLKTDIFSDRDLAYIKQFKNVVYTQHMAFYTDAAVRSMVETGVGGLVKMIQHESLKEQLC